MRQAEGAKPGPGLRDVESCVHYLLIYLYYTYKFKLMEYACFGTSHLFFLVLPEEAAQRLKNVNTLIPLGVVSLLYHAFFIRGYKHSRTDYQDGRVIFTIYREPDTYRCSSCSSSQVLSRGEVDRRLQCLPIGGRATFVDLGIPRVKCWACGLVRQVDVSFANPRRSYTKAFERYALELSRRMTIYDVARHLNVGRDLIKDIQKRDLLRRYAKPKLKHLRCIAIDEIAVAKGHRYLTVVMDLDSGAVVFVGDAKGADALKSFWKRLRPSKARIEAVAMDSRERTGEQS